MIDLDATARFVAGFEGFVGHVYRDAVGVETIGYGETDRGVIERHRGSGISEPEAFELLKRRVQEFADAVERCCAPAALNPNQHAAFTSLAYNIGVGAFSDSTACKRFKQGDLPGAADAMTWWNKGGGRVLQGLVTRRAAEARLFNGDQSVAAPGAPGAEGGPVAVLRVGSKGEAVADLQRLLDGAGFPCACDGQFGPNTEAAVRAFQGACGLVVDAIVGPATWRALRQRVDKDVAWPGAFLSRGSKGAHVAEFQSRLVALGFDLGASGADGDFGPATEQATRRFQADRGLAADGVVGPDTWKAAFAA